jgi:hypothetical protein
MITLYLIYNIKKLTNQRLLGGRHLIGRLAGVVELMGFAFDLDCDPAMYINVCVLAAPGIRL